MYHQVAPFIFAEQYQFRPAIRRVIDCTSQVRLARQCRDFGPDLCLELFTCLTRYDAVL
ncbi:hypothetical protein PSAC2689_100145 [Paraburkholderia sacchari]